MNHKLLCLTVKQRRKRHVTETFLSCRHRETAKRFR